MILIKNEKQNIGYIKVNTQTYSAASTFLK